MKVASVDGNAIIAKVILDFLESYLEAEFESRKAA
jgi:hypothetical protein